MTEPTPEAYEAARTAAKAVYLAHVGQPVTHAGRLVDPYATAAVDAVWPHAEATVRAKVAAEIRAGVADPSRVRRYLLEARADHPVMVGAELAARIAEGNGDETP